MKTKIIVLFLFISTITFGQDFESLKTEAKKMYDLTSSKKYDDLMDYTYPKVFKIIPKEDLIKVMNQMLDNEEMKISIEVIEPNFSYSKEITLNEAKYYVLEHDNKMSMKFKEKLGDSKEMVLEMMKESMQNYTISIDEKTELITVIGKAKIIAISDSYTNGAWKFLNYSKESPMMEKVISKEILQKLGL